MHHNPTKASALISALFFVALIAISVTAILVHLQQTIQHTQQAISRDERYLAGEYAFTWAKHILAQPQQLYEKQVLDHFHRITSPNPQIQVQGQLIDLQSKFNLNNLKDTGETSDHTEQKIFYHLILLACPTLSKDQIHALVHATHHWINDPPKQQDPLDEAYAAKHPPYVSSHQSMQHLSEFRWVQGVTPSIYKALTPYITVLPEHTAINLNTAPALVLKTLGKGMSSADAELLMTLRSKNGLKDLLKVNEIIQKYNIALNNITLNSHYFLCTGKIIHRGHILYDHGVLYTSTHQQTKKIKTILLRHYFEYH